MPIAVDVAHQQGRSVRRIGPVDSAGQSDQDLRRAKSIRLTAHGGTDVGAPYNVASDFCYHVHQPVAVDIRKPDRLQKLGSPAAEVHRSETHRPERTASVRRSHPETVGRSVLAGKHERALAFAVEIDQPKLLVVI